MTLRDSIKSDASSVFLNINEFAEDITYYPRNGGSRGAILAVVNREPPSFFDVQGNVLTPSFIIYVRNDYKLGITSEELDTGGDEIELRERVDEDEKWRRCAILRIIDQDFGMLQIALR